MSKVKRVKSMERKKYIFFHVILIPLVIIMVLPFLWMLATSLKDEWAIFTPEMQWIPEEFMWNNYTDAWNAAPFARFYFNTAFVAFSVVFGQLVMSVMAAYAFARLKFPGKNIIFMAVLGTLMLPSTIMFVPSYLILNFLGWIDTYFALIIPALFNAFSIFLIRQFFMTIPNELDESAIIDGCSRFGILWRIYLPLSKPALATVGIFTFMGQWNNFIWPLIVTDSEKMRLITVGIAMFRDQFETTWSLMMAASTTAILPLLVIFFFAQRWFIEGITLTGIKG